MPEEIWKIGFDGMVGGSGSYVEHRRSDYHASVNSVGCGKRVVDWLHRRGLEFYLESNNGLFASEDFREVARPVLRAYAQEKEASAEEVGQLEAEEASSWVSLWS